MPLAPWVTFQAMRESSPNQRANYLSWLANGRALPLADIGYAFLYFYGLERRLLIDGQDSIRIVKECVRLLETYNFSGAFDTYVRRFLTFILGAAEIETLQDKSFDTIFENPRLTRDEEFLAVALASLFRKNAALPVSWAMRMARRDPRSPGDAGGLPCSAIRSSSIATGKGLATASSSRPRSATGCWHTGRQARHCLVPPAGQAHMLSRSIFQTCSDSRASSRPSWRSG